MDFGNPPTTTSSALCLYDQSGLAGTAKVRLKARAPAGDLCGTRPCWKSTSAGFKYNDGDLTPDGLRTVVLKAGDVGKAKVTAKGQGTNLAMPVLPLTPKVTVQLQALNGECWSAAYSSPSRNDTETFKARGD